MRFSGGNGRPFLTMARCCNWAALLLCLLSGCQRKGNHSRPEFQQVYRELEASREIRKAATETKGGLITIAANQAPIEEVLREISERAGISIILERSLDGATVSMEVVNQPVEQVLEGIARRLSVKLSRNRDLFYLGNLRPEDKGILVRRVGRLSQSELTAAVQTLAADNGKLFVSSDGLLVMGDVVAVLGRVDDMLNQLEAADVVTWCVQMHLVSLSEKDVRELGLDVQPSIELAYTFAGVSAGLGPGLVSGPGAGKLSAGLDAVLRAARESDGAELLAEPLFLVMDGHESTFRSGEEIPIPRRQESQFGNVVTTGFDRFQAGLTVRVHVREVGQGAALLDVSVSNQDILDVVEGLPRTTNEALDTQCVIESGGVYLLGSLKRHKRKEKATGWLAIGRRESAETSLVQVWGRAFRVSRTLQ